MPISQERFMSLLRASSDVLEKSKALRHASMQINTRATDADLRLQADRLWEFCNACTPTMETVQTIATELAYFTQARIHKNNRDAARRRVGRGTNRPGDSEFANARSHHGRPSTEQWSFPDEPRAPHAPNLGAPSMPPIDPERAAELDAIIARIDGPAPAPEFKSPPVPPALTGLIDDGLLDEDDGPITPSAPE